MRSKDDLTQAELKAMLYYNPETGMFLWRNQRRPSIKPWDVAGAPMQKGYVQIMINQCNYLAHRLAWLYMTGYWPEDQIDHRDGVKDNNAWANLRSATGSENQQNQVRAPASNKSSGLLGVTWSKPAGKWAAQIKLRGKHVHLGLFEDKHLAHAAYVAAKRELHPFGTI